MTSCVVVVEGGGCPEAETTGTCNNYFDELFEDYRAEWSDVADTGCACSVESDQAACEELPGCVWATATTDEECDLTDTDSSPIESDGCYRVNCGSEYTGPVGRVDGVCHYDIGTAFPDD